ncbi:MAG: helix-turn-helix domain-containing protein [Silicimonas sp.]|nr:helix-turn-helix domain-containing protein [Silicimonas sp.]
MTDIALDAARVKMIRTARKIGRGKLAKLAGLTERQVARLETSTAPRLDEPVLHRLAEALQVPAPTLTGAFDITAEDLEPVAAKSCSCCG